MSCGLQLIEDPMPDDTLISDQVTALKNNECWRQSGGEITCDNCHNPHRDAPRAVLVAQAEKTCLRCHSATVTNHAGLCPVNRATGCIGCHMLDQIRGAFIMAEHWIRVHPEQEDRSAGTQSRMANHDCSQASVSPQNRFGRPGKSVRNPAAASIGRIFLRTCPRQFDRPRDGHQRRLSGGSQHRPTRSGMVRGGAETAARRDLRGGQSKRKVRHTAAHAAEFPRGCRSGIQQGDGTAQARQAAGIRQRNAGGVEDLSASSARDDVARRSVWAKRQSGRQHRNAEHCHPALSKGCRRPFNLALAYGAQATRKRFPNISAP